MYRAFYLTMNLSVSVSVSVYLFYCMTAYLTAYLPIYLDVRKSDSVRLRVLLFACVSICPYVSDSRNL